MYATRALRMVPTKRMMRPLPVSDFLTVCVCTDDVVNSLCRRRTRVVRQCFESSHWTPVNLEIDYATE
jgi:hypothetical protein